MLKTYRSADRAILISALLLFIASQNAAAAIPSAYRITDLETLGGNSSSATGINNVGQVTGTSYTSNGTSRPFLWTPTTTNGMAGTMIDLGTLGGTNSTVINNEGWDVNAGGHVAGIAFTAGVAILHAFLYDGTMHDLGTLGGSLSEGRGINDSGQVAGDSLTTGNSAVRPFLWTPTTSNGSTGTMIDLGTLGGQNSYGYDVNDAGHVAGESYMADDNYSHAFLWDGTMHDLGTLGGPGSFGLAINASGQVAGSSYLLGKSFTDAFLWTPTTPNGPIGTMFDLGSLEGRGSSGVSLNIEGQVVGTSNVASGAAAQPFVYDSIGGMVDLNSLVDPLLGWELIEANGINDSGQITGNGTINGQRHAFLLTPVPEPSTAALLVIGGVVALVARRRPR